MLQFAGLASILVFAAGLVSQYLTNDDCKPGHPLWLRALIVVSWVVVSLGLFVTVNYVQKSGQTITITIIILSAAAFLLGWGLNWGLLWLGSYYHANRGGRMFREVMANKQGRATDGQRRWQQ